MARMTLLLIDGRIEDLLNAFAGVSFTMKADDGDILISVDGTDKHLDEVELWSKANGFTVKC